MLIATIRLAKNINWLVSPTDKSSAFLTAIPGWAILHPLTVISSPNEMDASDQSPSGDGKTMMVSRYVLRFSVPESFTLKDPDTEEFNELLNGLKLFLKQLRYVSRQATLPSGDHISMISCTDVSELPQMEFEEHYGGVLYPDSSIIETALTMELVERAGELPTSFEAPVYEGILLDAIRAMKDNDFRSALLYSALAIEAMAGELIDSEHAKLLLTTPTPAHIRAADSQDGRSKGSLEDPVFKWMRKSGRFLELLHELPLYVYCKSLKQDLPVLYQQAKKLYQTRNSLAHRGESAKDKDFFPTDKLGAVDALKCVREVFAWFGVPGKWSIPFEKHIFIPQSGSSSPNNLLS